MKSVSLLLLVCLCARELDATELNSEVLQDIVKDFRQKGKDQFSFLIALNVQQCKKNTTILYVNGNKSTNDPIISANLDEFQDNLNYMAVYSDAKCSEFKILFSQRKEKQLPVWFGEVVKKSKLLKPGGCVIFYTEKTPCTTMCPSEKHFIDVMAPLKDMPFTDWRSDSAKPIHKYFVYGGLSNCNTDNKERIIHRFDCLDEEETDPKGSFLFRRCDQNNVCETCNCQNHYCVN